MKVYAGEIIGVVGESGCGKSTLGRTILRLIEPTSGQILYKGDDITKYNAQQMKRMRQELQIIFQDPSASLDPRMTVGEIIGEAVREHGLVSKEEFDDYIDKVMDDCGLQPYHKTRYPHEFSGGQRQRICIARALALNPEFIVCDEPVSALDVSIQAQVVNMFEDLQQEMGLTYLFIAHDLSVVKHISDSLGVMYLGTIVERAPKRLLFSNPVHPYTKALFSSAPTIDEGSIAESQELRGEIPSPIHLPSGCPFRTRCRYATERCAKECPSLQETAPGHSIACWNPHY